jgi:hypothetical protein
MIHYHGTPLSGELKNHLALVGKHAMVSYAKPVAIDIVAEVCQSFTLDNGAFTAWRAGTEYDFEGYAQWAEDWLRHPGCDFAVIPDVIDGDESENDYLVKEFAQMDGRMVPVWHLHESLSRLASLVDDFPRVAFGSSGQYAEVGDRKWWNRMAEAMDLVTDDDGMPMCKLHGLRMLDPGIFSYIPFASADSTNVARNIGIDVRWTGPYVPRSAHIRAMVIIDRIETHACASRWHKGFTIKQANFDLVG